MKQSSEELKRPYCLSSPGSESLVPENFYFLNRFPLTSGLDLGCYKFWGDLRDLIYLGGRKKLKSYLYQRKILYFMHLRVGYIIVIINHRFSYLHRSCFVIRSEIYRPDFKDCS